MKQSADTWKQTELTAWRLCPLWSLTFLLFLATLREYGCPWDVYFMILCQDASCVRHVLVLILARHSVIPPLISARSYILPIFRPIIGVLDARHPTPSPSLSDTGAVL